jgi:hypothetical protein
MYIDSSPSLHSGGVSPGWWFRGNSIRDLPYAWGNSIRDLLRILIVDSG